MINIRFLNPDTLKVENDLKKLHDFEPEIVFLKLFTNESLELNPYLQH